MKDAQQALGVALVLLFGVFGRRCDLLLEEGQGRELVLVVGRGRHRRFGLFQFFWLYDVKGDFAGSLGLEGLRLGGRRGDRGLGGRGRRGLRLGLHGLVCRSGFGDRRDGLRSRGLGRRCLHWLGGRPGCLLGLLSGSRGGLRDGQFVGRLHSRRDRVLALRGSDLGRHAPFRLRLP